jgi:hypothetical protein
MALSLAPAFLLLLVLGDDPQRAPVVHVESDVSAGGSTEGVAAGGLQIRLFGANKQDWRFFLEAAVGSTTDPASDAFGAAYPYDRTLRPIETYLEKMFKPGTSLVGIKAGRYRTPFGIYGRSDHAYNGFLRAPLIRYGGNWAISNEFLEAGADVLVGRPALYVETSLGAPQDASPTPRKSGLDAVVRAQGYYRSLIVGASYLHTKPNDTRSFIHGDMAFRGVDARWMRDGVLVRGEWLAGRPFDGVATHGGYVDATFHLLGMGPVTAVVRAERLDYDAGEFSEYLRRYTAGTRLRLTSFLAASVGLIGQPEGFSNGRRVALDAGVTCSVRF